MKKVSSLLFLLLSVSASAHAASAASASISNLNVAVLSGDAINLFNLPVNSNVNINLSDYFGSHLHDYRYAYDLPSVTSISLTNSIGNAAASTNIGAADQSLWATAAAYDGYVSSSASGSFFFDYTANSLVLFTATATVWGQGNAGQFDDANSLASLSLYDTSYSDDAFSSTSYNSTLSSGAGLASPYSATKQLKFYYFSDVNSKLQLTASVDVWASTAPVPEPESYMLLLAGLGLVGFAASRRRN